MWWMAAWRSTWPRSNPGPGVGGLVPDVAEAGRGARQGERDGGGRPAPQPHLPRLAGLGAEGEPERPRPDPEQHDRDVDHDGRGERDRPARALERDRGHD